MHLSEETNIQPIVNALNQKYMVTKDNKIYIQENQTDEFLSLSHEQLCHPGLN